MLHAVSLHWNLVWVPECGYRVLGILRWVVGATCSLYVVLIPAASAVLELFLFSCLLFCLKYKGVLSCPREDVTLSTVTR